MQRSAYVIAAWGGPRRVSDDIYERDRSAYLHYHLRQLKLLEHFLDLIIVAIPRNDGQAARFFDYAHKCIPDRIGTAQVKTLWRTNNRGLAFGSFEEAFCEYKDEADYWFFFEDDYVPMANRFDVEMIDRWRASLNPSFIAARLNRGDARRRLHALVSIGMTTKEKIEELSGFHGGLQYLKEEADYRAHEIEKSQRLFSGSAQPPF